ncbi:caspase family protein [Actinomycetota bacterium Odt1-20B]
MNSLHYAVVVGINRYPAISDLRGPRGDAQRFAEWLVDPAGGDVPAANVTLVAATEEDEQVTDYTCAKPTTANVVRALIRAHDAVRQALEERPESWAETRLYVFLAGHGIAPFGGDAALLMADAAMHMLGNHIAVGKYVEWYESASPFHEVVFFADCCRTRFGTVAPFAPPFTETNETPDKVNWLIGYAASLGDPAYESLPADPDQARGYFTTALLEGLRGAGGATVTDGAVTSDKLRNYVQQHVLERARGVVSQRATFRTQLSEPLVLARLQGNGAYPVTLRFPAGFRGWVELRGRLDEPRRVFVEKDESVESLVPGLYRMIPDSDMAPDFRNDGFFEVVTGGGNGVQF